MSPDRSPGEAVRAHDPASLVRPLAYRHRSGLPYDPGTVSRSDPLMLDTTVYVDQVKRALPAAIQRLLVGARVLHSGVACAELSVAVGILDPTDPSTPAYRDPILGLLDALDATALTQPSAAAWTEAGVLAGILARAQGIAGKERPAEGPVERCCRRGRQRSLLHDALIFISAVEHRAVLVSRNKRHMDLLQQVRPEGRILLYDRAAPRPVA